MRKRLVSLLCSLAALALLTWGVGSRAFDPVRPAPAALSGVETASGTPAEQANACASGVCATTGTTRTNAFVVSVVDGDTIHAVIDGDPTTATIRLLGINTPETVDPRRPVECYGKEASAHMHAFADGQRVLLTPDPQADERDKYGRLLRNLILADGTDVNAAMVRDGYAYAYLSFPLNPARKSELKKLENDARMAGRGLWDPQTCNGQK